MPSPPAGHTQVCVTPACLHSLSFRYQHPSNGAAQREGPLVGTHGRSRLKERIKTCSGSDKAAVHLMPCALSPPSDHKGITMWFLKQWLGRWMGCEPEVLVLCKCCHCKVFLELPGVHHHSLGNECTCFKASSPSLGKPTGKSAAIVGG